MNTPNRRLELRFRPDDVYSKPACGDKYNVKGFLLRVRVKKSRVKQVEETEAKKAQKKSTNRMGVDSKSGDNVQNKSDQVQSSKSENTKDEYNNTENKNQDQVISDLADQVQTCSVSKSDTGNPSYKNSLPGTSSQDLSMDTDTSFTKSEKLPLIFDRKEYEDLSEDKDYELPKLKVLGRVDTEFKFTSMCHVKFFKLVTKLLIE